MSRRVGFWALAGFAVACIWVVVGLLVHRGVQFGMWTITSITAPASIIGRSVHFPMTWYEFIVLNAVLYAVAGLVFELFRRLVRPPMAGAH